MPKLQKIIEAIDGLIDGVQGKVDQNLEMVKQMEKSGRDVVHYKKTLAHCEGQLYELNYVKDMMWRIINEE